VLLGLLGGVAPPLGAQVRYQARQLQCAGFEERARTEIRGQTGGRERKETAGREGVWRFRARRSGADLAVEGWYDSLSVWRESAEGRLQPDTDGLLGGRYRGRLSPWGAFHSEARPFIPDEVAEVADLSRSLDDLLPPLPPVPLAPGERWSDSTGTEISRLPDSTAAGRRLLRFEVSGRRRENGGAMRGDTVSLDLDQLTTERGRVVWDSDAGLVRRERHLTIETEIRPGGPVRQALRSLVQQTITLYRLPAAAARCEDAR
jgi:hypothetical protein